MHARGLSQPGARLRKEKGHGKAAVALAPPPPPSPNVTTPRYLFDHRNASLRSWLIQEYILGPNGLGSGVTDGFFIDGEDWHSPEKTRDVHPR
jgi:hypothetical protein